MTQPAVATQVDLTPFNTMGFSVCAHRYVVIDSEQSLATYFQTHADEVCFVLGGGSNLVLTHDIECTVLHMQNRGIDVLDEDDHHVKLAVQAGEVWHDLVMSTVERGWMGLENLALIPGSVGACPVQNIGAYGVEVKDVIESVKAWDRLTGQYVELSCTTCAFAYRDSVFKHQYLDSICTQARYVIVQVTFKLLKDIQQWKPKLAYGDVADRVKVLAQQELLHPLHVAQAIIEIRQSKLPDPKVLGNAGSFFKNPIVSADQAHVLKQQYPHIPHYPQPNGDVKIAAGWLIEQSGFKGKREGHVGVYDKQALVLVHYGQGCGDELMAFALTIAQAVQAQFGVLISPEPIVV